MQRPKPRTSTSRHNSSKGVDGGERRRGDESVIVDNGTDSGHLPNALNQSPVFIKEYDGNESKLRRRPKRRKSGRTNNTWGLQRFRQRGRLRKSAKSGSSHAQVANSAPTTNANALKPDSFSASLPEPIATTAEEAAQRSNFDTLHQAARAGDVVELGQILNRLQLLPSGGSGKSGRLSAFRQQQLLNAPDDTNSAPLHYAARYHHIEAVRLLLAAGADVNVKAEDGQTPLHYACRYKAKAATDGRRKSDELLDDLKIRAIPANPTKGRQSVQVLPRIVASLTGGKNALVSLSKAVGRRSFRSRASTFSAAFKQTSEAQQQARKPQEAAKKETLIDILRQAGANMNEQDNFGNTPLHVAVMRCNTSTVHELLHSHGSVVRLEIVDASQRTALHVAAGSATGQESTEIVQLLLRSDLTGFQFRYADANRKTPLHLAAAANNVLAVRMLLRYVQSKFGDEFVSNYIRETDENNQTPLLLAADSGHLKIVELLLKRGALVNSDDHTDSHDTALHLAANRGDVDMCDLLVTRGGAHVDAHNLRLHTPLHRAAAMNRVNVAVFLTRIGADVEARDQNAWTPLLLAARNGHTEIIQHLVGKAGADMYAISKRDRNALYLAASNNHVSTVRTLLNSAWGYELLFQHDRYGLLPIHIACKKGHVEVVRTMLTTLHNDNIVDERLEDDKTTLHLAAQYGWQDLLQLLIDYKTENGKLGGVMLECEDENGDTPLHAAALNGHYAACALILRTGANVAPRNVNQWSPLHNAASRGHAHVCELLLAHEAPLDQMDKNRTTPLHLAAMMGHLHCVVLLARHGAAVHLRDVQNRNALDFAIDSGHRHIAMYIVTNLPRWRDAMQNEQYVMIGTDETSGETTVQNDKRLFRNTPMRKLIRTMPDVAYAVLSMCMDATIPQCVAANDPNFKLTCHTDFIEDTFLGWVVNNEISGDDAAANAETINNMSRNFLYNATDASGGIDSLRAERHDAVRVVQRARPYCEDKHVLEQNHPVLLMVRYKREELLKHPLTKYFIDQKWATFGRPAFFAGLFLYCLFLTLLTGFTLCSRPINRLFDVQIDVASQSFAVYWADDLCSHNFSTNHSTVLWPLTWDVTHLSDNFVDVCKAITTYHDNGNCSMKMLYDLQASAAFTLFYSAGQYILPVLSAIMLVNEAGQSFALGTLKNKLRWLVHIFTIAITVPWRESVYSCANTYGLMSSWEWQLAAFNLLLAWIQLVVSLRNFPWLGLYVQFLQDVLQTVLRFLLPVCLLVLTAFALGFYNMFQALSEFNSYPHFIAQAYTNTDLPLNPCWNVFSAVIKTLTMFSGEYAQGEIFTNLNLPIVSILYMLFVFFCSIIMLKVMVGLAVDDINTMLEQAELKRIAMRVEFMLTLRRLMPIAMRSRHRQTPEDEVFYPNRNENKTAETRKAPNINHSAFGGIKSRLAAARDVLLHPGFVTRAKKKLCEYGIIGGVTVTIADVLRAKAQLELAQTNAAVTTSHAQIASHTKIEAPFEENATLALVPNLMAAGATVKNVGVESKVSYHAQLTDNVEQKVLAAISSLSPAQMQTFVARLQQNHLVLCHVHDQIDTFRREVIAHLAK